MKRTILNLTSSTRSHKADVQLGVTLAFIAGAVNVVGFMAVGFYTSHMSGFAASIGDHVMQHQWWAVASVLMFLGAFIAGATACSTMIQLALTFRLRVVFVLPLLLESLLMFGFAVVMSGAQVQAEWIVCLLCFIMGLQNAMITRISNAVIRTTHITGITTDIGVEIGRWVASHMVPKHVKREVDFRPHKLWLHVWLLLAFTSGGGVGAWLFSMIGFVTIVPLAVLLGFLAVVPLLVRERLL